MKVLEFILKNWESILSILVGIVMAIISVILTFKNKRWDKLKDFIRTCIQDAEKMTHFTGAEKKEYVITKANQFAIEKGIKFDAQKVGELIEELVKLTKKVNQREKDKTEDKVEVEVKSEQ